MKLGKGPPKFDKRTLLFGKYLTRGLAPPPPSIDYAEKVKTWPMYGNDKYGDCTCAAAGHLIQDWTANTGTERTLPLAAILKVYNHFSHGNPDSGVSMLDVLRYWRKTGFGNDKIHAFAQLELSNVVQAQDAICLFGGCYIGLALPNFTVPNGVGDPRISWIVPPSGPHENAAPNQKNGHCVPAVAYDPRNVWVVTWGALKQMSWQFYTTYADEAFALLSPDWISKRLKRAPPGLDLKTLESDLSQVTKA
ncbi:MAG TPA: hypothetical protein VEB87_03225 [Nitrososphaerales archaeon]|nr:hypothetical protein [Nitrososphaerales archaeon]